jgi:site-specific DNA-methyltransferase (adenine-specific)
VRKNDVHEAQFPLELPRRLIKLLSDPEEVVLDCFIGSGTTAIAALMEQRQFIGIEIVPEYAQLAQQRVAEYLNNRQETLCF